ncbi:RNA-directed DNA polymerase from mobile element jockey [Stylophora pistillata]|uniref:RNA-directed DNA polymerase from mobile element jockey n=1 Tax=Stylophora pistillata TaxID=50429 RepID=A0A2B4RM65_STYPI|nr:RNA-directed DNA polymerase from mobile element jockey [Stylophora pistillata]
MSASAPHICDIQCKQEITCQSYNYNRKEEICELNNRTKEARPENFRSASTWFYSGRLNGSAPLGSILQLPALSCQEMKASEGKDAISNKYWLNPTGNGKTQLMYCDLNLGARAGDKFGRATASRDNGPTRAVSETHLSAEDEVEAQIDGYTFIGKCRSSGKGGGAGVYISTSVPFHRRTDLEDEKSFLLRNLVWSNPSGMTLPQVKEKFPFRAVKEEEILTELKKLKRKKATGLDNLPPGLPQDAPGVIAKPLTFIINSSLATGVVPTEWKMAKMIPIIKSGYMAEIDSYRPISILPTMSKILKKTVRKQLMKYLEFNGFLSKHQFGFRCTRSTELAVTLFTDLIWKEAYGGKATGAIFIVLSKSFDTISHSVLLQKLSRYGIQDNELNWFTDYLFLRNQIAQFKGVLETFRFDDDFEDECKLWPRGGGHY